MDLSRFEQLIRRLEVVASRNPSGYRLRVALVAMLGFLILGTVLGLALLMVALLVGVVLVLFSGGAGLALVAMKLGKFLLLLGVPLWVMVKASFSMLFARFPAPHGLEIHRVDAPKLFARLDDMRIRMKGPAVHHVLLVDQLNAAVVQHPKFGLFGWHRNYLLLGLPLLQTLEEDEAQAVVAHEYGHLAGNHGGFGAFIYRLRSAWARMQGVAQGWNDWGSRLVARLFNWYAPYFNAYSFVLARADEYEADRSSAELVGAGAAASALLRVGVAARFEARDFWPSIDRMAVSLSEPPTALSGEWRRALDGLGDDRAKVYCDDALRENTGYEDTHPCLNDRLRALGAARLDVLPAIGSSAADGWFGDALPRFAAALDDRWRELVRERWQARNTYLSGRMQQLATLRHAVARSVDDDWALIVLQGELEPELSRRAQIEALLVRAPAHAPARFELASLKLDADDSSGIDDIEAVMQETPDAIVPGCETIWRWLRLRDPARAAHYRERRERRQDHLARVQRELDTVLPDSGFSAHDLAADVLADIVRILQPHAKQIARVWLLRRTLDSDPQVRAYVLAFEMKSSWRLSERTLGKMARTLASVDYPVALHLVPLGAAAFRPWRRRIRDQRIDALGLAA